MCLTGCKWYSMVEVNSDKKDWTYIWVAYFLLGINCFTTENVFVRVTAWISRHLHVRNQNTLYFQYIVLHFRFAYHNLASFAVWCYASTPSVDRNLTLSDLRIPPIGVILWDLSYYIDNMDGLRVLGFYF